MELEREEWNIETIKVILQAVTLLAVVVGLYLTIKQLRLLKDQLGLVEDQLDLFSVSYRDVHDWNRRKAAQDAIDGMVPRIANDTPMLHEKFQILTKHDPIDLQRIKDEIRDDEALRLAIHKRINYFESLAAGIQQGVFDEEVIKNAYQHVISSTLSQFVAYINYMRNRGSPEIWTDLEARSKRWEKMDRDKPPRDTLGSGPAPIRASKSEGG